MRKWVSLLVGWMCLGSGPVLKAQISQPPIALELQGQPRATQIPPYSTLETPQCDGSGEVYLRFASQSSDAAATSLAAIESDGSTHTISLATASESESDGHVFIFAAGADASLHEIVRVPEPSQQNQASTEIAYATFDSDGSLRSLVDFDRQFIPSLLLPLPDGTFFASGVTLETKQDAISEQPLAGIFSSDAILVRKLKKDDPQAMKTTSKSSQGDQDNSESFDGGLAKLGADGNIYVLLSGDKTRIAVITQSGQIVRELTLQEPFETDVAHEMWVSGNRILVVYEGETDDPKDAFVYVVYDTENGNVIRSYHPEFTGTIACFQDGETVSVLLRESASGKISLGTAELQ